jgi:ferredoxin-like protein FixX
MDGSTLQILALVALVGAMIITLFDMRVALQPASCAECSHCRSLAEAKALEQERLAREYSARVGLPEDNDDDRRIE